MAAAHLQLSTVAKQFMERLLLFWQFYTSNEENKSFYKGVAEIEPTKGAAPFVPQSQSEVSGDNPSTPEKQSIRVLYEGFEVKLKFNCMMPSLVRIVEENEQRKYSLCIFRFGATHSRNAERSFLPPALYVHSIRFAPSSRRNFLRRWRANK